MRVNGICLVIMEEGGKEGRKGVMKERTEYASSEWGGLML